MKPKRLLLVEDEEHLGFTLQFNLQEEQYHVDWAPDLAQARTLLAEGYDLILLDVMLPDGTGFSWCQEIRAEGNHTPVLFLTAKGSSDDIVTGLDAGADDYMTKPFVLSELLARIKAMIRRSSWQDNSASVALPLDTFTFGHVNVDFRSHDVTAAGKTIELTHLEFRLLRFFIEHQNQVVSREALLEHVWEVHASSYTRTVDNFLVRLRRLFEKDPAQPQHFLTVRGAGYKFVP